MTSADVAFVESLSDPLNVHAVAVEGLLDDAAFLQFLTNVASTHSAALSRRALGVVLALLDDDVGPLLRRAAAQVSFCGVVAAQERWAMQCLP